MDTSTPTTNKFLFIVCGVAFAAPSLFFAYYTVRLIYMNLTMEDAIARAGCSSVRSRFRWPQLFLDS